MIVSLINMANRVKKDKLKRDLDLKKLALKEKELEIKAQSCSKTNKNTLKINESNGVSMNLLLECKQEIRDLKKLNQELEQFIVDLNIKLDQVQKTNLELERANHQLLKKLVLGGVNDEK